MIRRNTLAKKWEKMPLGDIVDFLDNLRKPVTEKDREPGPYPYYGANGVQGNINQFIFDEPLILLAEDGGHFGNPDKTIAYEVSGKYWVNNHAHVLRPKTFMDLRFLCRHLERYDVTPLITGTTRGKLTKAAAEEIMLSVPPLAEQKRIAAILDQADAVRRKRQHSLQLADDFLRATFLDMFGDPVRNPNSWGEASLEQVAEVGSGVAKGKDYNGKLTSEVPYLRVANVQDGYLDLKEIKFLTVPRDEAIRYRLQPGDVLLTEGGDFDKLGRGTVWAGEVPNCIHQNHIFRVRVNQEKVLPSFVSFLIGSERGKRYFLRAGKQTTGIATINSTQLKQFPVLLPPIALQKRFLSCVETFHEMYGRIEKMERLTDDLFNSLVQRAFRGEL